MKMTTTTIATKKEMFFRDRHHSCRPSNRRSRRRCDHFFPTRGKLRPFLLFFSSIFTVSSSILILTYALGLVGTAMNHSQEVGPSASPFVSSSSSSDQRPPESVVLLQGEHLVPGQFIYSPSRQYRVGLLESGELVLEEDTTTLPRQEQPIQLLQLWSSGSTRSHSVPPNNKNILLLQSDGNLVVRNIDTRERVWTSHTSFFPGSKLAIDDGGQIALVVEQQEHSSRQRIWFAGLPPDYSNTRASDSLSFPIRGTFYYPWYPETFVINGHPSHFMPSLGWYSSSDKNVAVNHIESMDYAHIDVSIASWWGSDTHLDRPRLTMLLDTTLKLNSTLRWTVYYEQEMKTDPAVQKIRQDLNYLSSWFARHPVWARVDNRPLIFVYNDGNDIDSNGCDIARRWMEASQGKWYVVLKVFKDFEYCEIQADGWHQYGSGDDGVVRNRGYSYVVSPGFWKAADKNPRVPRLSADKYCQNVKKMVQSKDPWQLVLSFNEAGESTMIEPSPHWPSATRHGQYLDCLHGIVPKSAGSTSSPLSGGVWGTLTSSSVTALLFVNILFA